MPRLCDNRIKSGHSCLCPIDSISYEDICWWSWINYNKLYCYVTVIDGEFSDN